MPSLDRCRPHGFQSDPGGQKTTVRSRIRPPCHRDPTPLSAGWVKITRAAGGRAAHITALAREHRPQYVASVATPIPWSEWFWSKIWHCSPDGLHRFFAPAYSWWSFVTGCGALPLFFASWVTDPGAIRRRGLWRPATRRFNSDDWGRSSRQGIPCPPRSALARAA